MKFAYFGIPHTGGTYTVYHSLREGLAPHGIQVSWVGTGTSAQAALDDPAWAHERARGVALATDTDNDKRQAQALLEHLESAGYDGVFVNVLASKVQTNAVRYLYPHLLRVMLVHSISIGTYAAARSIRDHVHATVGVSPRIRTDLVCKFNFVAQHTQSIPTAVNLTPFTQVQRADTEGPLRLITLGRVIDSDKGVFWFPKIIEQLDGIPVMLTVVGDGPDLAELKRRCAHLKDRVIFRGRIAPMDVPGMLANHDVFLFPSRFEGLGLSLVEAMAAGCIPVASRIRQVTDFVITDGQDGLLFKVGDVQGAAHAIKCLAQDRPLLTRLSQAARQNVHDRFQLKDMAAAYAKLLREIKQSPPPISEPLPMTSWAYPRGLKPGLRTYLPKGIKN